MNYPRIMIHQAVKKRFPKIKLFYEKNTHKKVQSDYYVAVPYGKKYFAWFTYGQQENICILIEVRVERDGNFSVVSTQVRPVAFHNDLAMNTILFGSMLPKTNYFCVENVFYYKNEKMTGKTNEERLNVLENIFSKELRQDSFVENDIIFGLPIISNSFKWLMKECSMLPYQIYCIQCKNLKTNNAHKMLYKNAETSTSRRGEHQSTNIRVFNVMATIGVDNYQLLDKETDKFIEMAYIPNFNTSKLMNSIFRVIKENNNLDALEESDDEEEFEDTTDDKFVDLKKRVTMECQLHPTFKKWVPIKLLS